MHCKSCDVILSDKEDSARFLGSGTRVELCTICRRDLPRDLAVVDRNGVTELEDEPDAENVPYHEEYSEDFSVEINPDDYEWVEGWEWDE